MTNSQEGIARPMIVGLVAVIIIAGLIGYFAVNSSKDSVEETETEQIVETTPVEAGSMNTSITPATEATQSATDNMQAQVIEVDGTNFKFAPSTITVKQGKPVTIKFNNMEGFHDFVVDALDISTKQIQAGDSQSVTFTPTKKGSFEYYCSIGNHRA